MEDLKIRVNSEAESEEAQCLFFELGYRWRGCHGSSYFKINDNFKYITAYMRGMSLAQGSNGDAKKEITIPQLKDMVVLKRNDVSDATHCTESCGAKGFLSSEGIEYFWEYGVKEWNKHKHSNFAEYEMKPITREPIMKEYLNKLEDGTYKLVVLDSVADGVEPKYDPEDIKIAKDYDLDELAKEYKLRDRCDGETDEEYRYMLEHYFAKETLNDKVASAEVARQEFIADPPEFVFEEKHSHYKKDISHLDTLDIYRVTELFNPHSCGAHIAKKALCSGQRGHKDLLTDIQDIIDTAERWKEMLIEDEKAK